MCRLGIQTKNNNNPPPPQKKKKKKKQQQKNKKNNNNNNNKKIELKPKILYVLDAVCSHRVMQFKTNLQMYSDVLLMIHETCIISLVLHSYT